MIDSLLRTHKHLKNAIHSLEEDIFKHLTDWRSLAEHGFIVQAVRVFREENECTLSEAKKNIDEYLIFIET